MDFAILGWIPKLFEKLVKKEPTQSISDSPGAQQAKTSGDNSPITQVQTGQIVNVIGDLGPKIQTSEISHSELPDGHRYEAILTVESQYLVPQIKVTAYADSIQSLDVTPQRGGMQMFGHTGKREAHHFTTIQGASGTYRIRVTTDVAEQVQIDVE